MADGGDAAEQSWRHKDHLRMPLPRMPRPLPLPRPPRPAMAAAASCPSGCSERGLRTVSSTDSTKQAASVAAVMALIFTTDGSHTNAAKVSLTPPASQSVMGESMAVSGQIQTSQD